MNFFKNIWSVGRYFRWFKASVKDRLVIAFVVQRYKEFSRNIPSSIIPRSGLALWSKKKCTACVGTRNPNKLT